MRYSIAELLVFPCLAILAVGINGYINYLTIDIRYECVTWFGIDDWDLHRKLPRWLYERLLDVSGRPIDYAIACLLACCLLPFKRFARIAGLSLLLTLPISCFHSEIASGRLDRWIELPIALLISCLYVQLCRCPMFVSHPPKNVTVIVVFVTLGILGLFLLSRLPNFPTWHYRT